MPVRVRAVRRVSSIRGNLRATAKGRPARTDASARQHDSAGACHSHRGAAISGQCRGRKNAAGFRPWTTMYQLPKSISTSRTPTSAFCAPRSTRAGNTPPSSPARLPSLAAMTGSPLRSQPRWTRTSAFTAIWRASSLSTKRTLRPPPRSVSPAPCAQTAASARPWSTPRLATAGCRGPRSKSSARTACSVRASDHGATTSPLILIL